MRVTDLYFSWWLHPGKVRTLVVGGLNRTVASAPKEHDMKTTLPVVLALHGATMNGPMMAWFSSLNQKADEAGSIVSTQRDGHPVVVLLERRLLGD